ncbi:hypothetical protein EDD22DRAFT_381681 [Suillus occidentalis]|nr:hypothetical protein EDD22DRAFT_381681 [Suillus occidentalis]
MISAIVLCVPIFRTSAPTLTTPFVLCIPILRLRYIYCSQSLSCPKATSLGQLSGSTSLPRPFHPGRNYVDTSKQRPLLGFYTESAGIEFTVSKLPAYMPCSLTLH